MSQYTKQLGYQGEALVAQNYSDQGYQIIDQNFTMRGGEIDLITAKQQLLVFVEVKVINHLTEIHGYITGKKLHYVQKTIEYRLTTPAARPYKQYDVRLDVAIVRNGQLYEVYPNVHI